MTLAATACGKAEVAPSVTRRLPVPAVDGTFQVPGLVASVTVIRDRAGVAHIAAANTDDLFFAQGFVQAQERLFQMDLWRRSVQGRLSEVLGSNFIERDAMTRRIQFRGDRAREWESYGPDTERIAGAFTRGINAWIDSSEGQWPDEFRLAGWAPEYWTADDLLNRTDAFLASTGAQDEVFLSRAIAALGRAKVDALFPSRSRFQASRTVDLSAVTYRLGEALLAIGTRPFFSGFAATYAGGSNAWALPAAASASGAPLVAADPHRRVEAPSLRFVVHLTAPGWNVQGATAPWLPGVAIGHNERVAWAMAVAPLDVQDVVVERVNPANEHQVWRDGRWVEMIVEHEQIAVKGSKDPFEYDRLYTASGPIVGIDRTRHLAYALRWSGTEPGTSAELAAPWLNQATSADDFRARLERWKSPAADFVFADRDSVQRQRAGLTPVRAGSSGHLPEPGWIGAPTWRGWMPLDDLPHARETAKAVWAVNEDPARHGRLEALLGNAKVQTVDNQATIQQDTFSVRASQLLPLFDRLTMTDNAAVTAAIGQLRAWDRTMKPESAEARLYFALESELARQLAAEQMPADLVDAAASRLPFIELLTNPSRAWLGTAPTRARDSLLSRALTTVVEAQVRRGTAAPVAPLVFAHPLGISSESRTRFNVGPFLPGGDSHTLQAVSDDRTIAAPLRFVLDVADWDRSTFVNAPGQSGWPDSPHYRDHADAWFSGRYLPLAFSPSAVEASKESTLVLTPAP